MKRVQFEVDAKKYFEVDPDRLERVRDDDRVLVTIDFENQRADYIWYNPNAADPMDRNPASFPAEEDDFNAAVQLWEELGKPGAEPSIIERKENFPIDGEAYVVGELMGRYFFAWGPRYPFADELPEEDVTNGESGIQWFETEEEALQEYFSTIDAWQDELEEEGRIKDFDYFEDEKEAYEEGYVWFDEISKWIKLD